MDWRHHLVLFASALAAGMINSVAGGGTLLTFPALIWALGPDSAKVANATSTVALLPAALSSLWSYRAALDRSNRQDALLLAVPSVIGGAVGAAFLIGTDQSTFARLVPYLILAATLLFVSQGPLLRWQRHRAEQIRAARHADAAPAVETVGEADTPSNVRWGVVLSCQLVVAIYGGFFGGGIGILMLATFGWLGFTNIHTMNALKNVNGFLINVIAAALFVARGMVDGPLALWMAAGAIIGGYAGAGFAQRIGQVWVRRLVILIGFALAAWLFTQPL